MDEKTVREITSREIREAVEDAFSAQVLDKRYIDVSRIPLICQSIVGIDTRLKSIEGNISWGVRIVVGTVITALLGLIVVNTRV